MIFPAPRASSVAYWRSCERVMRRRDTSGDGGQDRASQSVKRRRPRPASASGRRSRAATSTRSARHREHVAMLGAIELALRSRARVRVVRRDEDQLRLAQRASSTRPTQRMSATSRGVSASSSSQLAADFVEDVDRLARLQRAGEGVDAVGVIRDRVVAPAEQEPAVGRLEQRAEADGVGQDSRPYVSARCALYRFVPRNGL